MEDFAIKLVHDLAKELVYNEIYVGNGRVEIFGGNKELEMFKTLDECRMFLFNEKRIHQELLKANRESYIRLRNRKKIAS